MFYYVNSLKLSLQRTTLKTSDKDHPVTIDAVMYYPVFFWPRPVDNQQGAFLTGDLYLAIFIYEYIRKGLNDFQDFECQCEF
jgi:hypothetical protein